MHKTYKKTYYVDKKKTKKKLHTTFISSYKKINKTTISNIWSKIDGKNKNTYLSTKLIYTKN